MLKLYKHSLFFFGFDKAGILNNPGNEHVIKGVINDNAKLNKVSFNKWYWVFLYITPNIEI